MAIPDEILGDLAEHAGERITHALEDALQLIDDPHQRAVFLHGCAAGMIHVSAEIMAEDYQKGGGGPMSNRDKAIVSLLKYVRHFQREVAPTMN